MSSRLLLVLAFCVVLSAVRAHSKSKSSESESSEKGDRKCRPTDYFKEFGKIFGKQNATAQSGLYTKDAVITTNAFGLLNGQDAVKGFFQNVFAQGFNRVKVTVSVSEPDPKCKFAMIVAKFRLDSKTDPKVKSTGNFWKILKKEKDGVFRTDIERLVFDA